MVVKAKPKPGDVGHLGGVTGHWIEFDGVGGYAFRVGLEEPTPENIASALETVRATPPFVPKTFGEKYVCFIDRIRKSVLGY